MINSGPSARWFDGDGELDYSSARPAQLRRQLARDGIRADFDHQLSGWSTRTGEMVRGFPADSWRTLCNSF